MKKLKKRICLIFVVAFSSFISIISFAYNAPHSKPSENELSIEQIMNLPDNPKSKIKNPDDLFLKDYLKKILGIQNLKDFKLYLKKLNKTRLTAKDIEDYQNLNAVKMLDSVKTETDCDTFPVHKDPKEEN